MRCIGESVMAGLFLGTIVLAVVLSIEMILTGYVDAVRAAIAYGSSSAAVYYTIGALLHRCSTSEKR